MQNLNFSNFTDQLAIVRRYTPAVLKHLNGEHGWVVDYAVYNPMIGMNERRRIHLNSIRRKFRTVVEFRMYANNLICDLNIKLASGWTPWTENENSRSFTLATVVMDKFMEEKKRDLRGATLNCYQSFCNMFKKWLEHKYKDCKICMITKEIALEYMEQAQKSHHWSPRSFNNNVKQGRAFFSWAVKKCYCQINPFDGIDTQRVQTKQRTIIPADAQKLIDNWFAENLPAMRIVMRMVYTSLLRPVEITRVQINQLDFEKHCIHMPGNKTKSWAPRDARMDAELEDLIRKHIKGASPEDFLFGQESWAPGPDQFNPNKFSKTWEFMRAHLLDAEGKRIIPKEFQLYSLKDTSITGMIKSGVDDLSVMQAAGHKDLKMTRIYADHTDMHLIDDLNAAAPKFGEEVISAAKKKANEKDNDKGNE